jgi:hypothetical protein
MYSMGLATVPDAMFLISHMHSSSRLWVLVVNRRRQSSDISGMVRCQRSTSPRSVGFCGSGDGSVPLMGMNAGSRSRYALAPATSVFCLNSEKNSSSK